MRSKMRMSECVGDSVFHHDFDDDFGYFESEEDIDAQT